MIHGLVTGTISGDIKSTDKYTAGRITVKAGTDTISVCSSLSASCPTPASLATSCIVLMGLMIGFSDFRITAVRAGVTIFLTLATVSWETPAILAISARVSIGVIHSADICGMSFLAPLLFLRPFRKYALHSRNLGCVPKM